MDKPFAPACERNREPILQVLREILGSGPARVLEIGAGTGQHALYFTQQESAWTWQCTDQAAALPGIQLWLNEGAAAQLPPPAPLNVDAESDWVALPRSPAWDWIYTANTLHIMSWSSVQQMFAQLPSILAAQTGLLIYGPFHRDGRPTSASNAAFDASLQARDPAMGIRDLEAVAALARAAGLRQLQVHSMPANNLLLVFRP